MKASAHFVSTLEKGLVLLRDKYGDLSTVGDLRLLFAVADSVRDGHQHNAKVSMDLDPVFAAEYRELKDAHLHTAIKAARKNVNV